MRSTYNITKVCSLIILQHTETAGTSQVGLKFEVLEILDTGDKSSQITQSMGKFVELIQFLTSSSLNSPALLFTLTSALRHTRLAYRRPTPQSIIIFQSNYWVLTNAISYGIISYGNMILYSPVILYICTGVKNVRSQRKMLGRQEACLRTGSQIQRNFLWAFSVIK